MRTATLERQAISPSFTTPIYRQSEVARILASEPSTIQRWATGYDSTSHIRQPPVLTGVRPGQGYTVSFLALAEAFVLDAFRKAGLPMQRIRPAVEAVKREIGLDYALANERLVHDGAEIFLRSNDPLDHRLIAPRLGTAVFNVVVEDQLRQIKWGDLGYAASIRLPQYTELDIAVAPTVNGGRPTIASRGIAVADILGRVRAGEPPQDVADDFVIELDELLYLNRAVSV